MRAGDGAAPIDRGQVEDFLFREAWLLDSWRLEEWLALWAEDGSYVVPTPDEDPIDALEVDPRTRLCLVVDDMKVLRSRVKRLMDSRAHAENPRSRTRHLIHNVRLVDRREDRVDVHSCFTVYRARSGRVDVYMGQYLHRLERWAASFRIRERRAALDLEALSPMGTISFIL